MLTGVHKANKTFLHGNMIQFERFTLSNGLKIIVHTDKSTPVVAFNLLYNVGARDEAPNRTGLAHLFEHLMFEGSENIPQFDSPLLLAGGENNAFTSNDITNYYITIPSQNLETAFWLESDRMRGLVFSEEKLSLQKDVVIEEYKQSYLNQPYGDVWLMLRPLAYKVHPYRWPTIGSEVSHIRDVSLAEARAFYSKYYAPNNAILSVCGNVDASEVLRLAEKWFGPIAPSDIQSKSIPSEPVQESFRLLEVKRDVPSDEIYITFHTGARLDADYYPSDLMTDILSSGKSSRLYQRLVQEQKLFSDANAYIMASMDPGLLVLSARLLPETNMEQAREALWAEINQMKGQLVPDTELRKVTNKLVANNTYSEISVLNKAMNLGYYELLGDANALNQLSERYLAVGSQSIRDFAQDVCVEENCSELHYYAEKA